MTIFAVLLPSPQPALSERIAREYPDDALQINDQQWLISSSASVTGVSARIGIADPRSPETPAVGVGIVFATSSYYGRAPAATWDWVKSKLQPATANG